MKNITSLFVHFHARPEDFPGRESWWRRSIWRSRGGTYFMQSSSIFNTIMALYGVTQLHNQVLLHSQG